MTTHPRPNVMALTATLVAFLVLAALAVLHAPPARADAPSATEPVRTFVIPASSTAILRWTFEKPPAKATEARFQISADKLHWHTLSTPTVKAGQKVVRTRWKAPAHAERRFFRLVTDTARSDLVRIRVK